MEKFILEVESEDKEDFKYALQEAIRQLEQGYTSGSLRNEQIDNGYWEIKKVYN